MKRTRLPSEEGRNISWSAEQWSRALAERFFTERSCRLPVLFFVDDEVLGEIYGCEDRAEAVESITAVVRRQLGRRGDINGYFYKFERDGRNWYLAGGHGCPPFLHLLAVCVLAAAHMGTGNVAPHNYYAQLRDLLHIDEPGTPRGFADSLDYLWYRYAWWLDDLLQGERGLSTVVEGGRLTHVGKPLSQTLFLGSDIRQLDDFFRWIHLDPSEDLEEDVLVMYFRAWAPGRGLSAGAKRLLEDPQFWPTLGRILGAYARQWDGTRSDREGSRTVALRVVVRLQVPRSVSLQALQPHGYPERLAGRLADASVSAVAEDGVFVVNGLVDPRHLLRGGTLGDDASRLTLSGSEVFILRLDPELGGWASVTSFVPGERHYVLAAPSVAGDVWRQLDRAAGASQLSIQHPPGAFGAWSLYGDVVLQGDESLNGVLGDSRPTLRHRFALRGGLPLGAESSYLSGGAPDVWLPPTTDASLRLTLDGDPIATSADTVRLARHLPERETASHTIGFGDVISRRISMIESHLLTPPPHEQPGHALKAGIGGQPSEHRMVVRIEDAEAASVTVVGPHVYGGEDRWSQPPVLLRRHAEQAWLLGERPGTVKRVDKPPEPSWMKVHRLSGQLYEARAPFAVQYSVERWPDGLKARERGLLEPGEPSSDGDVETWVTLVLGADLIEGDPDHWAAYHAAATRLRGGGG